MENLEKIKIKIYLHHRHYENVIIRRYLVITLLTYKKISQINEDQTARYIANSGKHLNQYLMECQSIMTQN